MTTSDTPSPSRDTPGREWLPIASAPKDETVIVVIEPTEANSVPYAPQSLPVYIDDEGRVCCPGTWKPDLGIQRGFFRATLWQPLPAPPSPTPPQEAGA